MDDVEADYDEELRLLGEALDAYPRPDVVALIRRLRAERSAEG